jgi:hypothetical protein
MRFTAQTAAKKTKSLLQAINSAAICENNWGQTEKMRRKWYFLDRTLLKSANQLLDIRLEMYSRN